MKKIQALLDKVIGLIQNNEYRSVKLHGVSCSRADLEMIQMYCETLLRGDSIRNFLMLGDSKAILEKAGIEIK